jgi:hypothetical protein
MTTELAQALQRANKLREPTASELGLPENRDALWKLEATMEAPRAAWRAYYSAVGYCQDERTKASKRNRRKQQ